MFLADVLSSILYTSVFVLLVSPQKLVLARCYTQIENVHLAFFLNNGYRERVLSRGKVAGLS